MKTKTSLQNHLTDLRSCFLKSALGVFFGVCVCWFFQEWIFEAIKQPISPYLTATQGQLIFINPLEKFLSYLKISLFSGVVVSCPYWLFQMWKFISPGLYRNEKKWSLFFVSLGCFLFVLGVSFVHYIVLPMAFKFLLAFGGEQELPFISLKEYISFFVQTACVFGFVFQVPFVLSLLIKFKVFSVERLKKGRPFVFVGIALVSAFITPPDVASMFLVMIPLYLFYEASLFIGSKI